MSDSKSGGMGFFVPLTLVFIALKLIGKIDWSWWWVLSPLGFCAFMIVCIFIIENDSGLPWWMGL